MSLVIDDLVKEITDALKARDKKTSALDTTATVKRVDRSKGIAWVHFPGGVDETPVKLTVDAKEGDTVQVRSSKGRAWITGNATAPPTDDKEAKRAGHYAGAAYKASQDAQNSADKAQKTANDAMSATELLAEDVDDISDLVGDGDESGITVTTQYYLSTSNTTQTGGSWQDTLPTYVAGRYYWTKTVTTYADGSEVEGTPTLDVTNQITAEVNALATATDQHFWHDSTGAYVTKSDKNLSSGYAMKVTTNGLLQTYNGNNLMSLTSSGLTFYQSDGSTLLASYSSGGAYLYAGGSIGASVTSSGMSIYSGSDLAASITSSGSTFYSGSGSQTAISPGGVAIKTGSSGYGYEALRVTKDTTKVFTAGTSSINNSYARMTVGGFTLTEYSSYYQITSDKSLYISPSIIINNGVSAYNIALTSSNSNGDAIVADYGSIKNLWAVTNASSYTNNVHIGSAGRFFQVSGSSKRWKNSIDDIHDEALDPHRLYDIEVKQFKFNTDYIKNKTDQRYDTLVPGFIAEQIQEVYPIAVDLDDEGRPNDWNMKFIIPPMLTLIQEQKKEIDHLTERVKVLEERSVA